MVPATLTTICGQHLLLTIRLGAALSTSSSPPLRTPAWSTSGETLKINGASAAIPYQTKPDQT